MRGVVVEVRHLWSVGKIIAPRRDLSFICRGGYLDFKRRHMAETATILYKRATFVTQLPTGHLYTPSHCWLSQSDTPECFQVGFTRFALRMLGELVDIQFEKQPGEAVIPGDVLGSIEGFKALSDIYCVGNGTFVGGNANLREGLDRVAREPYTGGWLYKFSGHPDAPLDVLGYQRLLDETIDRILAKQREGDNAAV